MSKSKKAPAHEAGRRRARRQTKAPSSRKPAKTQEVATNDTTAVPTKGKLAIIIATLRRRNGATIADLCKVTGWQAHSVRGAISGAIKKKFRLKVMSEKSNGVRTYRIAN